MTKSSLTFYFTHDELDKLEELRAICAAQLHPVDERIVSPNTCLGGIARVIADDTILVMLRLGFGEQQTRRPDR